MTSRIIPIVACVVLAACARNPRPAAAPPPDRRLAIIPAQDDDTGHAESSTSRSTGSISRQNAWAGSPSLASRPVMEPALGMLPLGLAGVGPGWSPPSDGDRFGTIRLDQGETPGDREISRKIRVVIDEALLAAASNVDIVTVHGHVTLRGSVRSSRDRWFVVAAAINVVGADMVVDRLEIQK